VAAAGKQPVRKGTSGFLCFAAEVLVASVRAAANVYEEMPYAKAAAQAVL